MIVKHGNVSLCSEVGIVLADKRMSQCPFDPLRLTIDYKDVAAFSILAIVLIFLPSGILGKPEVEKV